MPNYTVRQEWHGTISGYNEEEVIAESPDEAIRIFIAHGVECDLNSADFELIEAEEWVI